MATAKRITPLNLPPELLIERNPPHYLPVKQLPKKSKIWLGIVLILAIAVLIVYLIRLAPLDFYQTNYSPAQDSVRSIAGKNQFFSLAEAMSQPSNVVSLEISASDLKTLPAGFGQMINLRHLDLSNNFLESLPDQISNLRQMTTLDLSHNQLAKLPDDFGSLVAVQKLNLSYNRLTELPEGISKMRHLEYLNVTHNPLETISDEIKSLTKLKIIEIGKGQMAENEIIRIRTLLPQVKIVERD